MHIKESEGKGEAATTSEHAAHQRTQQQQLVMYSSAAPTTLSTLERENKHSNETWKEYDTLESKEEKEQQDMITDDVIVIDKQQPSGTKRSTPSGDDGWQHAKATRTTKKRILSSAESTENKIVEQTNKQNRFTDLQTANNHTPAGWCTNTTQHTPARTNAQAERVPERTPGTPPQLLQTHKQATDLDVACWNVNGIRSVLRKGALRQMVQAHLPDIILFSELKAALLRFVNRQDLRDILHQFGYRYNHWHTNEGKQQGHAGVGMMSRVPPQRVVKGWMHEGADPDDGGRIMTIFFQKLLIVHVYTPCVGMQEENKDKRTHFENNLKSHLQHLQDQESKAQNRPLVYCGDMNVTPRPQDAHPDACVRNQSAMPGTHMYERASHVTTKDTFNLVDVAENSGKPSPTWFPSERHRTQNTGMRVDVMTVSKDMMDHKNEVHVIDFTTDTTQEGSDHVPIITRIHGADDTATESHTSLLAAMTQTHMDANDDAYESHRDWMDEAQAEFEHLQQAEEHQQDSETQTDRKHAEEDGDEHQPRRVPVLPIQLNQTHTSALWDTGASSSLISEKLAHKIFGLQWKDHVHTCKRSPRFQLADGSIITPIGYVQLRVGLQGKAITQQRFFVLGRAPTSVILGVDFFEKVGAVISFDAHTIALKRIQEEPLLTFTTSGTSAPLVHDAAHFLRIGEDITIPARRSVVIEVTAPNIGPRSGITQRAAMGHQPQSMVATSYSRAREDGQNCKVTISIGNMTDTPSHVKEGTIVGEFAVVQTDNQERAEYQGCNVLVEQPPAKHNTPNERNEQAETEGLRDTGDRCAQMLYMDEHETNIRGGTTTTSGIPEGLDLAKAKARLSKAEFEQLLQMIDRVRDVFAPKDSAPNATTEAEMHIDFEKGTRPIFVPPRAYSPQARQIIIEHVEDMERLGVIEKSQSSFNSPILLINKKDGKFRMCVDLRRVNAATKSISVELPKAEEILSNMAGSKWLSSLDVSMAYYNIPLAERDRHKTSFSVPSRGTYQFTRCCFGAKNSQYFFVDFMQKILKGLIYDFVVCYVDDILVHTKDDFEDHLTKLEKVLTRLRDHGVRVKAEKCIFCAKSVQYMGYVISERGVEISDKARAAIQQMQVTDRKSLLRFMGSINFWRCHIKDMAQIASPLRPLLKKGGFKTPMTEEQHVAIQTLKELITSNAVLAHPDWSKEFFLISDGARGKGIAACLAQKDDQGNMRPVRFISRALQASELNYAQIEVEVLAALYGMLSFRYYLETVHFTLVTDSSAMKTLETAPSKTMGRQARWSVRLSMFSYTVHHRPGTSPEMATSDSMSRSPCTINHGADVETIAVARNLTHRTKLLNEIREAQKHDKKAQTWRARTTEEDAKCACSEDARHTRDCTREAWPFIIYNDCLYRVVRQERSNHKRIERAEQLYIPETHREAILHAFHGEPVTGHMGRNRTLSNMRRRVWWPSMSRDTRAWVRGCLTCCKRKNKQPRNTGQPDTFETGKPFAQLQMDIAGPFIESYRKNRYILTLWEPFLKYPWAICLPDTDSERIARAILEEIIQHHGVCDEILCDNATYFHSDKMQAITDILGIRLKRSLPYTPSTLPGVERHHAYLNASLCILSSKYKKDWDDVVPWTMFCYRNTSNSQSGVSPFQALYGRDIRAPIDALLQWDTRTEQSLHEFARETRHRIREAHETLRAEQQLAGERSIARLEGRLKPEHFFKNEWVLVYDRAAEPLPTSYPASSKLRDTWRGPYKVVTQRGNRIRVIDPQTNTDETVHITRVHRYYPWSGDEPSVDTRERLSKRERMEMKAQGRDAPIRAVALVGDLVAFPLQDSPGFGIGKVLRKMMRGLIVQWYGNTHENPDEPFQQCWFTVGKEAQYYYGARNAPTDRPYTNVMTRTAVLEHQLGDVGFDLQPDGRLTQETKKKIKDHTSFIWLREQP